MYNNFHIEKSRIKDYPLIVYTLGYSQISDYILSLEVCLKNKDFKGKVIFDLLQSNGLNNRYYTFIFNGEKFDYNSRQKLTEIPTTIQKKTNEFQIKNKGNFDNGILTKPEKFRFHNQYNRATVKA